MIYSEYGTTGLRVSAVGFGGMRFDMSKSEDENAELLLYAHDKGVNYFDTAPFYCKDKSEIIFGRAFKQMADRHASFYVSTKGSPVELDTADKARAAVEKSLKRLNVDAIDFYHVWCVRTLDQYELAMKKGGQYEGLMKCKEQGLIKHIAVSTHLPGNKIGRIVEERRFEGILMGVNILNFLFRWEGVRAAHDAGLGVVAMNPLSGGVIPEQERRLSFLAGPGETPTEAALRFCISCPQITDTHVGYTTKEHIDTACRVAEASSPFTRKDIERIKAHVSTNMVSLCTGCGYCLDVCPQNIPVPGYMQYYNEKPLCDKTDKEMVDLLKFQRSFGILAEREGEAGDCVACGACEEACTQHLDITERLKQIAGWEEELKKAKTQ